MMAQLSSKDIESLIKIPPVRLPLLQYPERFSATYIAAESQFYDNIRPNVRIAVTADGQVEVYIYSSLYVLTNYYTAVYLC